MNPNDDSFIIDLEVTMKVSIGFSMMSGASQEQVEATAEGIAANIDSQELLDNWYKIEAVNIVEVEQE
jgi:hypothetical protein